jgi:hypothetical protein
MKTRQNLPFFLVVYRDSWCIGDGLTLIIYEIFRQKSGTKAVKNESKSKPPLLVNVRFFSFPSVQKAEIGHKKKRTTIFVPLFSHVDIFRIYCPGHNYTAVPKSFYFYFPGRSPCVLVMYSTAVQDSERNSLNPFISSTLRTSRKIKRNPKKISAV